MKKVKYIELICMGILLLISCEKDNDQIKETKNTHRVKQIIDYYNEEEQSKSTFAYDGERLIRIMEYEVVQEVDKETKKTEITYQGENAIETIYTIYNNGWILNTQNTYNISKGLVLEITTKTFNVFENKWEVVSLTEYEYSGNDLVFSQKYVPSNLGELVPDFKDEYLYDGSKIDLHESYVLDEYSDWILYDRDSFLYSADLLKGYIDYREDYTTEEWIFDSKVEMEYSGNNVSLRTFYIWSLNDLAWEEYYKSNYSYNENGYLILIESGNTKQVIEYEEGHGNAKILWYSPSFYLYGSPQIR